MPTVETEVEDHIAWLTFTRSEKLNAFNAVLLDEFTAGLQAVVADDAVRCIIVRGRGRAFSVGYDVDSNEAKDPEVRRRALTDWLGLRKNNERWLDVWRCPKPVIAAIHGFCMGAATQLAVCCDLTVVADDAVIGWPSVPLGGGLLGPVSCWLIGPKKAKELSYIAGSRITGAEAAALGWANYAVRSDTVETTAFGLAKRIVRTPPDLLTIKKRAINRVMDVQGFSEVFNFGAEYDAIAHDSEGYAVVKDKIAELGFKGAMAWFAGSDGS
jgi:enoyl-CoA hydratase